MKSPAQIKAEGRMPTAEELKDFYEGLATAKQGQYYAWGNQHIDTNFGRTKFAQENINPGDSVLECGCCDGGMSRHLINAVGSKGTVTLMDISPSFVERAKEWLQPQLLLVAAPKVEFVVDDASTFTTRRRYDVIVAMEMFEHVPSPKALLENLWGLLKKNSGKILITVPVAWNDLLGERLNEFTDVDLGRIIAEVTNRVVPIRNDGTVIYAVIDKNLPEIDVPYVP